jgi:carboxypeptidase T
MKLCLLILLAFSVTLFAENIKKIKLFINNDLDKQKVYSLSVGLEHSKVDKEGGIILYVDDNEFQAISNSGLNYEILIDDWKAYYHSLPQLTQAEKEMIVAKSEKDFGVNGFGFGSMGGYYTFAEIETNLDEMFQLYPNLITQKFSVGTSVEGRTIWAVKISDNPNVNENEPAVGLDALVHAREPQSMATLMYFIWYLLENYGTDPQVTYLVNNREIYCVPCFNPDGYEYNHLTDPNGGGNWRKNRRNNGNGCYGIDLNRNFSFKWGYDNIGSSSDPCSETYRGPSAFSEPESQAIRDLAIQKHYGTHFNMHTYGDDILYPWGYIDAETPDSLTYREFAADLASYNGYAYGTGYQLLGYPSNGAIRDWMYGEQTEKNKIYSYTIEIGPSFWPSQSEIFPVAQQNVRTLLYQCFVAGEYVQLVSPNFSKEYFLPDDFVQLNPKYKNKGLSTAYNVYIELTSPSPYINMKTFFVELDSIQARSSIVIFPSLSFIITNSAPLEEEIPLILTTKVNDEIISLDTVKIIIGYPVYIFADSTNDPNTYWTITKTPASSPQWDSTYKSFYSPPNSYTDSKNGNYINNATITMTLTDPIDISGYTNPRFSFRTKFDIENDYDYGQAKVSTNNGSTWIPLEGNYTNPGVSPQPAGQPVYDGVISNWVKEDISLANYLSSQFKIQFQLKTDQGVTRDGWYIDDIGVFVYTIPTNISGDTEPGYEFSLGQNYPNPFNPSTKIHYTIPSVIATPLERGKQSQLVTLKVFDVLGKEVETLVNEEKPAGSYEVDFNASQLSSGVYFYKLQTGSFTETKKMILMK